MALLVFNGLEKRDLNLQLQSLSTSYQNHLVAEYSKNICEISPNPRENKEPLEIQKWCVAGITERARKEVAAAKILEK